MYELSFEHKKLEKARKSSVSEEYEAYEMTELEKRVYNAEVWTHEQIEKRLAENRAKYCKPEGMTNQK